MRVESRRGINEGFIAGSGGDAKAVEGNVPNQFIPVGVDQIFGNFAVNPGVAKHSGDVVGARFRPSAELADDHGAVIDMLNDSRREAVQTDETQTAHDLFDG